MKRKRRKSLISLLLTIAMICSMVMPVSAAGQPILTVTHNQSESIQKGDGTVDVVYTITLDPNGNQVAAFQFTLEAPQGMTLATNEVDEAGAAGYWYNWEELMWAKQPPYKNNPFKTFEYSPGTGYFGASGGEEGRTMDSSAMVMTIQATIDISQANSYELGVTGFSCYGVGSVDQGGSTPIVPEIEVVAPHVHVFDQQVTIETYKVSGATCTNPAVYYYSCTCEEKGIETFNFGAALGHDYTQQIQDAAHLKTEATNCTEYNVYWYDCARCDVNAKDDTYAADKYYSSAIAGDHVFTEQIEDAAHLVNGSGADCQNAKKYYFDCAYCATIGTTTWTSNSVGEHVMSQQYTQQNNQHFKECTVNGCNHTTAPEKCSGGTATCSAKAICSVCNNPYGDYAAHSFTAKTVKAEALVSEANCQSAAVYYYSCNTCGEVENNANHTFMYGGTSAHTPSATYTTDDTKHWKVCTANGCGVVIDGTTGNHTSTGANVATCQKLAVCDTCGVSYGSVASHNMASGDDWSKDGTGHWYECKTSGCTNKTGFAAHTPNHQGGATEEYAIECTECGFEIEAQLGHTHVFDKEIATEQYKATPATCETQATYYKSCKCGDAGSETFSSGPLADHSWEPATCTEPKECSVCHLTEGTANGHTEGAAWKRDDDNHWHVCTVADCGAVIDSSVEAHIPNHQGGATEEYAILCTECGFEIEAQLDHTHVFDKEVVKAEYKVSSATCQNLAVYKMSCKCGLAGTETFEHGDYADHKWNTSWTKDETGHWYTCKTTGCGEINEFDAHTPDHDEATEDYAVKCEICYYEIEPKLSHVHVPGTEWKSNSSYHWNVCEKATCGAVIEDSKEAHVDADHNSECDICGYDLPKPEEDKPEGWIREAAKWYYYDNGKKVKGWEKVGKYWFFFKKESPDYKAMQTGWIFDEGRWYFLGENGVMKTGWREIGGKWYYLGQSGAMKTGWFFDPNYNAWYYLHDENGDMLVNTTTPDGYYVGADGKWVQ